VRLHLPWRGFIYACVFENFKISSAMALRPFITAQLAAFEEQRATHENRLHFPPAVAHSLNEAIQVETSQSVLFLDTTPTHPVLLRT
jgi:hypothetical protein